MFERTLSVVRVGNYAMAHRTGPVPILLAVLALGSCTVFNGKSLPEDAGGPANSAQPSAAPSGCACPATGTALCADFETAIGSSWSVFGGATVDSARAHCGASSLHLHSDALRIGDTFAAGISETQTFATPAFASGFFARAYFYIPSAAKLANGNYTELFKAQQDGAAFAGIAAELHDGDVMAITDWAQTPVAFEQTTATLARDTWTCVEWQLAIGPTGASRLWFEGVSAPSAEMTGVTTVPSPPFGKFFVSLYLQPTAPQLPFDVWVDDVVIDVARVGCGR